MENKEVIRQIKNYMESNRLNQTAMANKLGIATSQLNRWLKTARISNAWVSLLKEKRIIEE